MVDGKPIPDFSADLFSEQIRHGFAAMDVEIIHNQMDRLRFRVCQRQFEDNLSELNGGSVGSGEREVPPGLWLNGAENIGGAASLILTVPSGLSAGNRC